MTILVKQCHKPAIFWWSIAPIAGSPDISCAKSRCLKAVRSKDPSKATSPWTCQMCWYRYLCLVQKTSKKPIDGMVWKLISIFHQVWHWTLHVHIGHSALYLNQTNEFQSILDISWSGHAVAVLRVQAQSFTNVDLRYHSPVDHWSLSNIKPWSIKKVGFKLQTFGPLAKLMVRSPNIVNIGLFEDGYPPKIQWFRIQFFYQLPFTTGVPQQFGSQPSASAWPWLLKNGKCQEKNIMGLSKILVSTNNIWKRGTWQLKRSKHVKKEFRKKKMSKECNYFTI